VRALGVLSTTPETHGADVAWEVEGGLVGVQRKTLDDLDASLRDGRLAREVTALRFLSIAVLLLEGRLRYGPSGRLLSARSMLDRAQLRGLLWSAQQRGIWVVHTDDVADSVRTIRGLAAWVEKVRHASLDVRARAPAGSTHRDWGVRLLQCFPAVGPLLAGAVWDHFGGVPLQWSCTPEELAAVRGIGGVRSRALLGVFERREPGEEVAERTFRGTQRG
jgi:DNA excision repair protein ERCC-4